MNSSTGVAVPESFLTTIDIKSVIVPKSTVEASSSVKPSAAALPSTWVCPAFSATVYECAVNLRPSSRSLLAALRLVTRIYLTSAVSILLAAV